ncbi:MAG TPA: CHAT domain-containing tetratricopeptide repeat protein [Pyrinomonadaceae bacterium]|nr:CHAT domain-containing tetratricopeptide repeat protein [Pyrinomonadaceae bacterium]
MLPTPHRLIYAVAILLILFTVVIAQENSGSTQSGNLSSDDLAASRNLITNYFGVYSRKDADGLFAMWNPKSPAFAAYQKRINDLFARSEKIGVANVVIAQPSMEGNQVKVRAAVEMTAIEAKTSKPLPSFGKMHRTLYLSKEDGTWKIAREISTEEEVAAELIAAKTDAERTALLGSEKDFVNPEMLTSFAVQANVIGDRGNFAQAMMLFTFVRSLAEQVGDKNGLARALNGIGRMFALQGNFDEALVYYHQSMNVSEAANDQRLLAATYVNVASAHRFLGDYEPALQFYNKARTTAEATKDDNLLWRSLNGIALIYSTRGDYRKALEAFQKALAIVESSNDPDALAGLLNNIGNAYRGQGNLDFAERIYDRSLSIAQAAKNQRLIAFGLNNQAVYSMDKGDFIRARELNQQSLALKESLGDKTGVSSSLQDMGTNEEARGDFAAALNYYNKCLEVAEALKNKQKASLALASAARVLEKTGDHAKALEFGTRAAALAKEAGDRPTLLQAQTTLGRAHRSLDQLDATRESLTEAIATIESMRADIVGNETQQWGFLEDKLDAYNSMIELLISQNKTSEALAFAESAKARVLLDVLHSGRINVTKAMTNAEQEQEQKLKQQMVSLNLQISRESQRPQRDEPRLNNLEASLQKARGEYEAFQTSLYVAHPELKARRGDVPAITLEDAAAMLPDEKSALLEYVVTKDKTFLFALKRQAQSRIEVNVYPIEIKEKDLTDRVSRFREQMAKRDLAFQESARSLYDLLLAPALRDRSASNLVIVPSDILWELPFQALRNAKNRYLIEDSALSYAPSLSVLREMMKARKVANGPPTLLAFGNPSLAKPSADKSKAVLMGNPLDPLPEAEKQVAMLGQLYGPQSKVYVGAEAREEVFKSEASKYRFLQLATHGVLDDSSPMYSHLVLSQTETNSKEDGLLEAWELMNLDLHADLVVLSACETARGRVGLGEGVIGLTWALFVAGSPTTVVSQWKVESASTTALMLEFHRNLRKGMSKSRALQQASVKLLADRNYAHPFYWAGFIVVGDQR